jgi:hypothetical protein
LGNQVHHTIQTLFPNKDAVFQEDNAPIYTAGTVQSWFEKMKVNFNIFLASIITRFEHHWTTLVSFGN